MTLADLAQGRRDQWFRETLRTCAWRVAWAALGLGVWLWWYL